MKKNGGRDAGDLPPKGTVAEQAMDWVVRLESESCSPAEREAFLNWIKRSPEHLSEYLAMDTVWNEDLGGINGLDREVFDRDWLQHNPKDENNVVPLAIAAADTAAPHPRINANPRRRRWQARLARPLATAAGIAGVLCLSVLLYWMLQPGHSLYTTDIGEQRSWTLEDGSVLHLNTQSRLKIQYSEYRRLIILLAGEALFDVAHDTQRPFYVRTDDALVRAVGTSFNVYRNENRQDATVVTVVEGKVAVSPVIHTDQGTGQAAPALDPPPEEHRLAAGGQVTIKSSGEILQHQALTEDIIETAIAWRERKLVFAATPLSAVAAEFNRYNRRKIVISSNDIGMRGISGVFDSNRPGDLLAFLEGDSSVKVIRLQEQFIIDKAS